MHGARSTVLRAFSHFHAIYRCFPYSCTLCKPDSQLKIDPTPTHLPPAMDVVKLISVYPLAVHSPRAAAAGGLSGATAQASVQG